jgi:hypothetical protein
LRPFIILLCLTQVLVWISSSKKNSLVLIELSSINKDSLGFLL